LTRYVWADGILKLLKNSSFGIKKSPKSIGGFLNEFPNFL